jgi:hypothetical protein
MVDPAWMLHRRKHRMVRGGDVAIVLVPSGSASTAGKALTFVDVPLELDFAGCVGDGVDLPAQGLVFDLRAIVADGNPLVAAHRNVTFSRPFRGGIWYFCEGGRVEPVTWGAIQEQLGFRLAGTCASDLDLDDPDRSLFVATIALYQRRGCAQEPV